MRDFNNLFAAVTDAFGTTAVFDPASAGTEFDCLFEVIHENDFDSGVIVEVAVIEFESAALPDVTITHNSIFEHAGKRYQALYPPETDDAGWNTLRARRI